MELLKAFSNALSDLLRKAEGLRAALERIRGVSIAGFRVELWRGKTKASIAEVLDAIDRWASETGHKASELALRELNSFLKLRAQAAERYKVILRAVAEGFKSWSMIKRYLEVSEGRRISDSDLAMLLKNLVDAGFLEKTEEGYQIPNPILAYAIRKGSSASTS